MSKPTRPMPGFGVNERVPRDGAGDLRQRPARPGDGQRIRADAGRLADVLPRGLLPRVK